MTKIIKELRPLKIVWERIEYSGGGWGVMDSIIEIWGSNDFVGRIMFSKDKLYMFTREDTGKIEYQKVLELAKMIDEGIEPIEIQLCTNLY